MLEKRNCKKRGMKKKKIEGGENRRDKRKRRGPKLKLLFRNNVRTSGRTQTLASNRRMQKQIRTVKRHCDHARKERWREKEQRHIS